MSKELTKKEQGGLVLQGTSMAGMEDMDRTIIKIPRIKLLQATSPEVQGEEFRDYNLRASDVIDSVTKEKLEGAIIPIKVLKNTHVLFVPRNAEGKAALKARCKAITDDDLVQQGAIICSALDGVTGDRFGNCRACGLADFKGQEKPICSRSLNVLVMTEQGLPAIISFRDTSFSYGRQFLTLLNTKGMTGTPMHALKFAVTPVKKTEGDKQWYVQTMTPKGMATQEEYDRAYKMYVEFNKTTTTIVGDDGEEPTSDVEELI